MRRALAQVSDVEERSPSLNNLSKIVQRVLDTLFLDGNRGVISPASRETPYYKALENVMCPAEALAQARLRTTNHFPARLASKQCLVEALENGMADLEAGRQQDQTGSAELHLSGLCATAKRMGSIVSSLAKSLDDADFLNEAPNGDLRELDQAAGGRSLAWRHCDEVAASCEALADACEALILAHDRRRPSLGSDMKRDSAVLSVPLVGGLGLHRSSREAILREVSARLQSSEGGAEADEALDGEEEQLRDRALREGFVARLIDEAASAEKLERTYDSWMPWL
ncbi:hypothetical protein H632_c2667p0 [Helicosporidium sp. ATCC 50920]|nr:hypothetical protein H632_c2667p0 [Helicosporidium sp. ATCC 50920]|eukprot:KDD72980.1 hypothetical protein H632_c2667p0 [Helicosporidium sp. ATCC 50920]